NVSVAGTLAQVVDGTATASITLKVAGAGVPIEVSALLGALTTPIVDTVLGTQDDEGEITGGIIPTVIPTVTSAVTGAVNGLSPVLTTLNQLVSLRGNLQVDATDGSYSETAL